VVRSFAVLLCIAWQTHAYAGPESTITWVTATAYNSLPGQTDSTPWIAAWGDRLSPDMKVIAVSRDLLGEGWLARGTRVRIEGLEGEYTVLDKMNARFSNRIDVYMGSDLESARRWGVREVQIEWTRP
jgi:3D (Asp-Asp-Asp) domain-containing protein